MEGLIFGGAYLQREICVSKSIGLTILLEVNLPFLLCFTLYLRAIFQVKAPGGLINNRRLIFVPLSKCGPQQINSREIPLTFHIFGELE